LARVVLFRDYTGAELEINTPLTSNIDFGEIRRSLQIPTFVNTGDYLMERAVLTIHAAMNAHHMHDAYPDVIPKNFGSTSIPALLLGGIAIRMHSPSSNLLGNAFFRQPNDVDLIVPKSRGAELVKLLLRFGQIYGTRYYCFATASDKAFNAIRSGQRYRVRVIEKIAEDGTPFPGVLDILVDCVDLRHKIDVRDDFGSAAQQSYTISLANLLLTKCQVIFDAPRSMITQMPESSLHSRVLDYPHLKSDRVIIGMEEKDIRDVCAVIADNSVRETRESINLMRIRDVLQRDKKFALTVRLNLQNIVEKPQILEAFKIGRSTLSRITDRIQSILKVVPVANKKWDKPWWNVDVETPEIFWKDKPP
jgi:hypothetical protein